MGTGTCLGFERTNGPSEQFGAGKDVCAANSSTRYLGLDKRVRRQGALHRITSKINNLARRRRSACMRVLGGPTTLLSKINVWWVDGIYTLSHTFGCAMWVMVNHYCVSVPVTPRARSCYRPIGVHYIRRHSASSCIRCAHRTTRM
jgi:hypothetical protein